MHNRLKWLAMLGAVVFTTACGPEVPMGTEEDLSPVEATNACKDQCERNYTVCASRCPGGAAGAGCRTACTAVLVGCINGCPSALKTGAK
ncbi:hypothetical protein SAMN05443572_109234 [Myxococcus fulvus]|uniref:Lipoprotein n=1 Tax=Myxococcus fulvus TaxID=33 RepID=A0A511T5X8_MYXFU|nr:hypothetical protein MFU01_46170 [Myxococcus fulvus]SEU33112.1 hypothetical protein SAMN05443572_109234 [Myxococcus fulvus]